MSKRELRRVEVFSRVASEELKLVDAAEMLRLSYRQVKRIWQRYQAEGPAGLQHRSAGRESNRAKPQEFRDQVLEVVREKYSGPVGQRFGPTLAAEHLESEDGLLAHPETLRRWMLKEGLWTLVRKQRAHRRWREPKEHFGELVQLDGSFHHWFEDRGPEGCLMNMVDDATTETLGRLGEQETIWTAAGVLRCWIETYGVPLKSTVTRSTAALRWALLDFSSPVTSTPSLYLKRSCAGTVVAGMTASGQHPINSPRPEIAS